ncbi:MAG: UvrD-helicase domain-containing protein [Treponema sp.]|nr:UvrD-helicase domain-containing protein [Treponema sp.]
MARELDISQKKAVGAELNSVVSAGAGSGKTSVLSARFAHLVLEKHYNVDEILTLTFTKKATVEMYSRIYSTLKEKSPESTADFYKANIKTLDSYCAYVAKLGSRFYGIAPDFTEDKDAIYKKAEDLALPFILKHRDNFAIKALVQTKNFAEIASGLFVKPILENSTVAEPIDFDKAIERQKDEICSAWKSTGKRLLQTVYDTTSALQNYPGNITASMQKVLDVANGLDLQEIPQISAQDFEEANVEACKNFIASVQPLADVDLPRGKSSPELNEIKDLLRGVRQAVADLYPIANYVAGGKIIGATIPLLKEFQETVNRIKRTQGILTFKDIASLATCILRDHPEIRLAEKKKYKAIMIDEFQDNNSLQRDLLFMLAEKTERKEKGVPFVEELEKDKLFFVGDEKQSIYRFRDADVTVFRGLSKDFSQGNMELKTNYRSHPALITAFNTIFGGEPYSADGASSGASSSANSGTEAQQQFPSVFYTTSYPQEEVPDYEAVYRKVDIPEHKKEEAVNLAPRIHFAVYAKDQEEEKGSLTGEEAEAAWVAKKILELTSPDQSGKAKYKVSDITVLFKTYALQPLYERTFLNYGIPYNTEVVTGFFNDGPANDIFSFMRICAYKTDSLAYAQVLRSPFVNLSNSEANAIILQSQVPFEADAKSVLSQKSLERYQRAKEFYEELSEASQTQSITKTLDALWYKSGYCYETMWNRKVNMYASFYDRVFELARQADVNSMSLASFTDSVRSLSDEKEKLDGMDIPIEKNQGVSIMTIHKSKGLEFPVVFICGSHKGAQNSTNASPVYSSKDFGISINTPPCKSFADKGSTSSMNYFYNKVKEEEDAKEAAELRRVAYVAVTRAESEVYITAVANRNYPSDQEKAEKFLVGGEANPSSIIQIFSPLIYFYSDKENAPFTFQNIPPVAKSEIPSGLSKGSARGNTKKEKLAFAKEARPLYENAKEIQKEEVAPLYLYPSLLEKGSPESNPASTSRPQAPSGSVPFKEINEIVESSDAENKSGFSYDSFGTIAHAYMEASISGQEVSYPQRAIAGLEGSKEKIQVIEGICKKMAESFKASQVGKAACASEWKKTEFPFKSLAGKKIVKGTIDLIFKEQDGSYTIVDYKTNQSIEPELYYSQLACYRQAASRILGVEENSVRCILYYLRFGEARDISDECSKIDMEKFA